METLKRTELKEMLETIGGAKGSLSERVAQEIEKYIIESGLTADDRLPNEQKLAERLGVSRSTVREAIKILVSRNVVRIERGRGTFITEQPGVAVDPLGFNFVRDKRKLIHDLLEMRLMVEPSIAALAAERATPEEHRALREQADCVETSIRRGENHAEGDAQLHMLIAAATHNDVVSSVLPVLHQAVALFLQVTGDTLLEHTITAHRAIVDAIVRGDAAAASAAMADHLMENRTQIARTMQTDDPATGNFEK